MAHCIADFSADIIKITIHLVTMGFNDAEQLEWIRTVATEFRAFCTYAMIVIEHTERTMTPDGYVQRRGVKERGGGNA